MKTPAHTIALTHALQGPIRVQVASGRHADARTGARAGLRAPIERDQEAPRPRRASSFKPADAP